MGKTHILSAEVREWLIAHPHASIQEAAAALGKKVSSIRSYRSVLICEGLIPRQRSSRRNRQQLDRIVDIIESGRGLNVAAKEFGIDVKAVSKRLTGAGLTVRELRAGQVYGVRFVGALFGYSYHHGYRLVLRWHQQKLIKLSRSGVGKKGAPWTVTADELMRFLDNPATWHIFEPHQLTDPDWREYAIDARNRYHLRAAPEKRSRAGRC